jgi:hypothetical protein
MRTLSMLASTLALGAALAACSSSKPSSAVSSEEAKSLLIDRNWLDTYPQTERDKLHVYRFVPSMGGGVFQDRTLFKGVFELFSFSATGTEIKFTLHETHDEVTSAYTIEPVEGPAPFDLKLTISDDPRGPKIYYGIKAETDVDGHLLEQRLTAKR